MDSEKDIPGDPSDTISGSGSQEWGNQGNSGNPLDDTIDPLDAKGVGGLRKVSERTCHGNS